MPSLDLDAAVNATDDAMAGLEKTPLLFPALGGAFAAIYIFAAYGDQIGSIRTVSTENAVTILGGVAGAVGIAASSIGSMKFSKLDRKLQTAEVVTPAAIGVIIFLTYLWVTLPPRNTSWLPGE